MNTQIIIDNLELRGGYWHVKDREGGMWFISCNRDGRHQIFKDKNTLIAYLNDAEEYYWVFIYLSSESTIPLIAMIEHLGVSDTDPWTPDLPGGLIRKINEMQKQIEKHRIIFNEQQKQIANTDKCFDEYDTYTRKQIDELKDYQLKMQAKIDCLQLELWERVSLGEHERLKGKYNILQQRTERAILMMNEQPLNYKGIISILKESYDEH